MPRFSKRFLLLGFSTFVPEELEYTTPMYVYTFFHAKADIQWLEANNIKIHRVSHV